MRIYFLFCTQKRLFSKKILYISKKSSNFAAESCKELVITHQNNSTMARPIAETPILYGEDAERFMQRMHNVQKISAEEKERMRKSYEWIKSISTFAF